MYLYELLKILMRKYTFGRRNSLNNLQVISSRHISDRWIRASFMDGQNYLNIFQVMQKCKKMRWLWLRGSWNFCLEGKGIFSWVFLELSLWFPEFLRQGKSSTFPLKRHIYDKNTKKTGLNLFWGQNSNGFWYYMR